MFHLGDVVRKLREAKGLTQTQLGQRAAGLNKDTIRRIEQGESMRQDTLARIAAALDRSLPELYGYLPADPAAAPETPLRSDPYTRRLFRVWDLLDTPADDDTRLAIVTLVERLTLGRKRSPG